MAGSQVDGIDGLGKRTDLVDFDEDGIGDFLVDAAVIIYYRMRGDVSVP